MCIASGSWCVWLGGNLRHPSPLISSVFKGIKSLLLCSFSQAYYHAECSSFYGFLLKWLYFLQRLALKLILMRWCYGPHYNNPPLPYPLSHFNQFLMPHLSSLFFPFPGQRDSAIPVLQCPHPPAWAVYEVLGDEERKRCQGKVEGMRAGGREAVVSVWGLED